MSLRCLILMSAVELLGHFLSFLAIKKGFKYAKCTCEN